MSKQKKLGQFFTPPMIAQFMAGWVLGKGAQKVLDPTVGPGVFMQEINLLAPDAKKTAYEIDPEMIDVFKNNNKYKIDLFNEDYLTNDNNEKYDAIICNPPYNKFQEIDNRHDLIRSFKKKYGIRLSGYTNYCIYFLIKSINELAENGRCCFIIPYEFLNTGYGSEVKKYLIKKRILNTIIKFSNNISLFGEAVTTACILLLEKNENKVRFVSVGSDSELLKLVKDNIFCNEFLYKYDELDPKKKWNLYFSYSQGFGYNNCIPFLQVARAKRGIATGDNSYFLLKKDGIEQMNLSSLVCVPCITKSPDVNTCIFDNEEFEKLYNENKNVYIFDGCKASTCCDKEYIRYGEEMGVHKKYLTSHRTPWYKLEDKEAAPIWISVFSRDRLKVVRNLTAAKNLTAFHSIYINDSYSDYTDIIFCFLLTSTAHELLFANKREYGDGLNKLEPNDINNALILDFKVIKKEDISRIMEIYNDFSLSKIEELDSIFKNYIM